MTITEYCKLIKEENEDFIVLIKYGKFYRCFDYDAFIIHYLLKYKLTSKNTIGFPIECLDKVLNLLKHNNLSTIVVNNNINYIKYEVINNKYNKLVKNALNYNNEEMAKNDIICTINNKISKDFSLLYKIKTFIDNLN